MKLGFQRCPPAPTNTNVIEGIDTNKERISTMTKTYGFPWNTFKRGLTPTGKLQSTAYLYCNLSNPFLNVFWSNQGKPQRRLGWVWPRYPGGNVKPRRESAISAKGSIPLWSYLEPIQEGKCYWQIIAQKTFQNRCAILFVTIYFKNSMYSTWWNSWTLIFVYFI